MSDPAQGQLSSTRTRVIWNATKEDAALLEVFRNKPYNWGVGSGCLHPLLLRVGPR